jgi:hypothetical protein
VPPADFFSDDFTFKSSEMFRRAAFSSHLKSKVGNILAKATSPTNKPEHRWRSYSSTCTHSPLPFTNLSPLLHFPRMYPFPRSAVCNSPPAAFACNLSPHRHPFLNTPPSSRFISCNKSIPLMPETNVMFECMCDSLRL